MGIDSGMEVPSRTTDSTTRSQAACNESASPCLEITGKGHAADAINSGGDRGDRLELSAFPEWPPSNMMILPPGRFLMGSPDSEERWEEYDGREEPQHEVNIGYRFALGEYPVTVGQFAVFVDRTGYDATKGARIRKGSEWIDTPGKGWHDPGFAQTANHPVCCVSWEDAKAFVAWLNTHLALSGRPDAYRLPHEAEWEYACRAGTTTPFSFGTSISTTLANYDGRQVYGGSVKGEFRNGTACVSTFPANSFGLYDMHGNVCEWCEDVWHVNYHGAPTDGSAWITGGEPRLRVLRGGSWSYAPRGVRSANRSKYDCAARKAKYGFRLARTVYS